MTTIVAPQIPGADSVGQAADAAVEPIGDAARYDAGDPRRIALRGVEPAAHHRAQRG